MSLWSWGFVALMGGVVPFLAARSGRVARELGLTRGALYAQVAISLWIMAAIGYLVLRLDGQGLKEIGVTPGPLGPGSFLLWTGALTAAGLGLFALSHALGLARRDADLFGWMRPETVREALILALVVAPSAGLCEEFLYRGILLDRLGQASSPLAGLVVSSLLFGGAHLYQGWRGAARAGLIGAALAASPLAAGSLLPAMAAHAFIDILGVLVLWPILQGRAKRLTGPPQA